MKKDVKLRRNHCKKIFLANGKWSKFSKLWPKLMPAKTQKLVFGIFSSILLNMSQLTDNLARYSVCRYDMSIRQKNTKNYLKFTHFVQILVRCCWSQRHTVSVRHLSFSFVWKPLSLTSTAADKNLNKMCKFEAIL